MLDLAREIDDLQLVSKHVSQTMTGLANDLPLPGDDHSDHYLTPLLSRIAGTGLRLLYRIVKRRRLQHRPSQRGLRHLHRALLL